MDKNIMQATLHMAQLANKIGPAIAEEFGEGSTGAYTHFGDRFNEQLLLMRVAAPAKDKIEKYKELAQEKATRLHKHKLHYLSWQSMNKNLGHHQGAVRAGNPYIIFVSTSGFPSRIDQGFDLILLRKAKLMTPDAVASMSRTSGDYDITCRMWKFAEQIW